MVEATESQGNNDQGNDGNSE